jgi:hypothetical protein
MGRGVGAAHTPTSSAALLSSRKRAAAAAAHRWPSNSRVPSLISRLCRCRTRRAAWPQRHKRIVSGRAVRRPHRPDGVLPLASFGMPSPTARNPLRVEAPGTRPHMPQVAVSGCTCGPSTERSISAAAAIACGANGSRVGLFTALRRQTGVMGGTSEKAASAANGLGVTEATLAGVIFEGGGFCTAPA